MVFWKNVGFGSFEIARTAMLLWYI